MKSVIGTSLGTRLEAMAVAIAVELSIQEINPKEPSRVVYTANKSSKYGCK